MGTFNFAGTAANPFTPSQFVVPVGTLQRDTTGARRGSGKPFFAHDVDYGSSITATATIPAILSFDYIYVGAVVRSGANAAAFIGVRVTATNELRIARCASGADTDISNALTSVTVAPGDILSVTYNKGTGAVTATLNGTPLSFTGTTTDSTYAGESTLSAGGGFDAQNSNGSYISQFDTAGESTTSITGTGALSLSGTTVAGSGSVGTTRSVSVTLRDGSGALLNTVARRFWTRTSLDAAATDGSTSGISVTCDAVGVFNVTGLTIAAGAGWLTYSDPGDTSKSHNIPVTFA